MVNGNDDIGDFDLGLDDDNNELLNLNKQLVKLKTENTKLKDIIRDNNLEDELDGIDITSVEEQICINGISHIASLVESGVYEKNDITNFDILYKVLRSIHGKSDMKVKKEKKTDIATLLKIAQGTK